MLSFAGIIGGLFGLLSFVILDLLTLPLRTIAGESLFALLSGTMP